mgnify:FL=1
MNRKDVLFAERKENQENHSPPAKRKRISPNKLLELMEQRDGDKREMQKEELSLRRQELEVRKMEAENEKKRISTMEQMLQQQQQLMQRAFATTHQGGNDFSNFNFQNSASNSTHNPSYNWPYHNQ